MEKLEDALVICNNFCDFFSFFFLVWKKEGSCVHTRINNSIFKHLLLKYQRSKNQSIKSRCMKIAGRRMGVWSKGTCLRGSMFRCLESIFMHDPISFPSIGCTTLVKNQGLPHPYNFVLWKHSFISPCCLPKSGSSGSISSSSGRILPVLVAEEVPLVLFIIP